MASVYVLIEEGGEYQARFTNIIAVAETIEACKAAAGRYIQAACEEYNGMYPFTHRQYDPTLWVEDTTYEWVTDLYYPGHGRGTTESNTFEIKRYELEVL